MTALERTNTLILSAGLILGLGLLGWLLRDAAVAFKQFDRTVTVKGLSESEFPADLVIWPIQFSAAGNQLQPLYESIEASTAKIRSFLQSRGIEAAEISVSAPAITDRSAQGYGGPQRPEFRYSAVQVVTVYSQDVARVRGVMSALTDLGKQGIAFTGGDYRAQTEYLFTRLNQVKPEMIEDATAKAREVALKFAADSRSRLGKIKRARQGQFSISDRDKNNPHIKRVRVVSTIEYYLAD